MSRGSSDESNQSETDAVSRRGVVKATAAAIVGSTGVAAMSGPAAAGKCDYDYPAPPSSFGELQVDSRTFSNWPWGTSDITMFIHGFTGQSGSGAYAYEVYQELSNQGYGGHVVSTVWPAGDSWDDWYAAKQSAIDMGKELADILDTYGYTESGGVSVNFVAHSLGGKMALECARELHATYGHSVNTINLLGAAVWDEQPGERFYDGILYGTNATHNYYSENDGTLANAYQTAEFGRHACGYTGGAGGEPWNWYEHNVSSYIHQHCEYMDSQDGCITDVATNL